MNLAVNIAHRQRWMVSVGERLRKAANLRGYDLDRKAGRKPSRGVAKGQADLERASGVPTHVLSRLKDDKRGTVRPNAAHTRALALALNVRFEWLHFGLEPMIDAATSSATPAVEVAAPELPRNGRERVWWALHALPRSPRGEHPSFTSLGDKYGGAIGELLKDFSEGAWDEVSDAKAQALQVALGVSAQWLARGVGDPPKLSGPLPPLPEALARYRMADPLAVALAAADSGKPISAVNNYTAARDKWRAAERLTKSALLNLEQEHDVGARFNEKTVDQWCEIFFRAYQAPKNRRKQTSKKKKPAKRAAQRRHAG